MGGRSGRLARRHHAQPACAKISTTAAKHPHRGCDQRTATRPEQQLPSRRPTLPSKPMQLCFRAPSSRAGTSPPTRGGTGGLKVASAIAAATAAVATCAGQIRFCEAETCRPLTSGEIQTPRSPSCPVVRPMTAGQGQDGQVKAGPMKLAAAGRRSPWPPIANHHAAARARTVPETSSALIAKVESGQTDQAKIEPTRPELAETRMCRRSRPVSAPATACAGVLPASSLPALFLRANHGLCGRLSRSRNRLNRRAVPPKHRDQAGRHS